MSSRTANWTPSSPPSADSTTKLASSSTATQVFDLLDVEAEAARDAGRREADDADVLEGGWNRESDGLSGHGRVHSDVHLQAHPSRSARAGRRYATLPLRCMRETG
jgi:hypothetical protein